MSAARQLGRLRLSTGPVPLPFAAACAIAAFALAATVGWSVVALLIAATCLAPAVLARRRTGAAATRDLERISSVALAPGASLHAIRFRDRVLLVGASQTGLRVLDRLDEPDRAGAPSARAGTIAGAVVALAIATAPALGAQTDSAEQRANLEPAAVGAMATAPAPPQHVDARPVDAAVSTGPVVWLAVLALLPFAVMAVTSFVKITVVLSLLRSGLGTPQVPSDPVLAGIALALTAFVMAPVARESARRIDESGANPTTAAGAVAAVTVGVEPVRAFLVRNTRTDEIALFVELSARDGAAPARPDALEVLVPAFVTSELRRAFIAGFFILVPFLVVDLVVSNILMSMGMVMVSPATVSLPFKIMLFVLIDGWPLLMKGLALGYH